MDGMTGQDGALKRVKTRCGVRLMAPAMVAILLASPAGARAAAAGDVVLETDNTTDVAEGEVPNVPNSTDSFTVALSSQPLYDVAVVLSTDDGQTSVSPDVLTFTPLNWNTFQEVAVTAVDDTLIEGPHTGEITYLTSSSDPNYDGMFLSDAIWVNIDDNDNDNEATAPLSVSHKVGSERLMTSSHGSIETFVILSLADGTANEDGDQAAVVVSREGPGSAPPDNDCRTGSEPEHWRHGYAGRGLRRDRNDGDDSGRDGVGDRCHHTA